MSQGQHLKFTQRRERTECRKLGMECPLQYFFMDAFGRNMGVPDRVGTMSNMVNITTSEKMGPIQDTWGQTAF